MKYAVLQPKSDRADMYFTYFCIRTSAENDPRRTYKTLIMFEHETKMYILEPVLEWYLDDYLSDYSVTFYGTYEEMVGDNFTLLL